MNQTELEKIEKRIKILFQNKIEFTHNITNSIEGKKTIIENSKLNINSYTKDLNDINQNYPIFVRFDVNIDRYIVGNETKFNKNNLIIDYTDIESKTKILDRTLDQLREKAENFKNKFSLNMKDLEKYVKLCSLKDNESNKLEDKKAELKRKKNNLSNQVQTLVSERDEKIEEFENIKKNRKIKFNSFFKKLSDKLTTNYKELTKPKNSMSPGGTAFIYTTNEEEPYLGTVCYLPTPPGKRIIYDIDQLSGGEKTIAILSLVISLQSICCTPFIILDEIDSYLDTEHESILENLFKTQNKNFQIILVTHKSNIFRSAQSLIGTYFNKQRYSTIPISVDMTKIH